MHDKDAPPATEAPPEGIPPTAEPEDLPQDFGPNSERE